MGWIKPKYHSHYCPFNHPSKAKKWLCCFNPFISFTPSKPHMSSGSWLALHNCESITYQQLIMLWPCDYRSNFHQCQYLTRAMGGRLIANFLTCIKGLLWSRAKQTHMIMNPPWHDQSPSKLVISVPKREQLSTLSGFILYLTTSVQPL